MGPHRTANRMTRMRRRQTGVTAIGFICLASVFVIVGLAGLKIAPLYMQKMRVSTVLADVEKELSGNGSNPQNIRNALQNRFYIEGIKVPRENVSIKQVSTGYQVHIEQENRTPFIADLWFVVMVDEQVEIRR